MTVDAASEQKNNQVPVCPPRKEAIGQPFKAGLRAKAAVFEPRLPDPDAIPGG